MKRPRVSLGLVAALLVSSGLACAQPPLWLVRGRHTIIYLFGSVHLLPPGLDWAPPRLLEALPKAKEIWFELPIDETTDVAAAKLSLSQGYLPAGDSLSKHLTPDQDARLRRVCGLLGLPRDAVGALRPWLAEVTLSLKDDERAGASAAYGVEQQLQALAPASAKRHALETPRQQIAFLAGAALSDQIASLDETLHEIEDQPRAYQRVLDGWMTGDLEELDADALEPLRRASPALYRRLITDRNAHWAKRVKRRLAGSGVVVVVVGAGHLLGPEGLPARLRAAGVTVEGP